MRQGVARRSACFSRLERAKSANFVLSVYKTQPERVERKIYEHVPALNKVLEVLTPFDFLIGLVLQLGDRLTDDIRQQIDETGTWLHFRAVRWEGEAMLCDFKQCNA